MKYTPEDSGIIIRVERDDSRVIIRFIDSGGGISDEDKEKITDKFYRCKTNLEIEGSGRGLWITKNIIKQEGGELHPDIITLDNTMPVLSGLEAAEEIFQYDKDVRIIFISALGDSKLYRAEIEENYQGDNFRILTKPIEKADLEKILNEFPTGK